MRAMVRTVLGGALALVAAVMLALTSSMTSVFTVVAAAQTTALIMGGTGDPLVPPRDTNEFVQSYMGMAVDSYIAPAAANPDNGVKPGPYNAVAVYYPARFSDLQSGETSYDQSVAAGTTNLHACLTANGCIYNTEVGSDAPAADDGFVVFGYSQSTTVATFEKRRLAAEYAAGEGPDIDFVFIGNGNRPNGGLLARGPRGVTIPAPFIFNGATFSGPTPTNTQYDTVDVAGQYDVWADVPLNPLNILAIANWYKSNTHYNYQHVSLDDPGIIDQGQYGDTHYYLIPTKTLPLLSDVDAFPIVGHVLADALDAPLRVIVEAAYDRSSSPGKPIGWNPLYMPNPVAFVSNLALSVPTAWDNAFEDTFGVRLLGTVRPGPFGVGGPPVTYTTPPEGIAANTADETAPVALTAAAKEEADTTEPGAKTTDSDANAATAATATGGTKPADATTATPTPSAEPVVPTTEPAADDNSSTEQQPGADEQEPISAPDDEQQPSPAPEKSNEQQPAREPEEEQPAGDTAPDKVSTTVSTPSSGTNSPATGAASNNGDAAHNAANDNAA